MKPVINKRYLFGCALIVIFIIGGFYRLNLLNKNSISLTSHQEEFVKSYKSKSGDFWHKISKIGLHSPLDITWSSSEKIRNNIVVGIDSLLNRMDSLFNENKTWNPFYQLSRSKKKTKVELNEDQFELLNYLLVEISKQNKKNSPLKLGAGEWVYRYRLTEDTSSTMLTESVKDSLVNLFTQSYFKFDPQTNQLWTYFDSLHLTLGSVSKGFGIKKIAEYLHKMKVKRFLINAGGDLQFSGKSSRDTNWSIGIRHPRGKGEELLGAVFAPLTKFEGLATSGDYELFQIINGKRIHHLIDANTGEPISDKQSLSVLAKDGLQADYYATYLFLLPIKEILNLVDTNPEIEVMLVDSLGNTHFSQGMRAVYKDIQEILKK